MNRHSSDKDINKLVWKLIRSGWHVKAGKKHRSIESPSGRKIAIPSTPGDHRACRNFSKSIDRISSEVRT